MTPQSSNFSNKRQAERTAFNFPVQISLGSQVTIQGQLKDVSLKSAFVKIKGSIYLQLNDELEFTIQCSPDNNEDSIGGSARISRLAAGEGIAIYFTQMDDGSAMRLKELVETEVKRRDGW